MDVKIKSETVMVIKNSNGPVKARTLRNVHFPLRMREDGTQEGVGEYLGTEVEDVRGFRYFVKPSQMDACPA